MTYFKGDAAKFTGKTQIVAGATFYEVVILEGHLKGETKLVKDGPKPKPSSWFAELPEAIIEA